jgi:hypothetical protein
LVGDDDAEAGGAQRIDLFVPGVPEFREAVEENDGRAVLGACDDGIQRDFAILKSDGFQQRIPRWESLLPAADGPLGKKMPTQR